MCFFSYFDVFGNYFDVFVRSFDVFFISFIVGFSYLQVVLDMAETVVFLIYFGSMVTLRLKTNPSLPLTPIPVSLFICIITL